FDDAAAVTISARHITDATLLEVLIDRLRNRLGLSGHCEGGERCVGIRRIKRPHACEFLRHRVGNFPRVSAGPDARAIDAAATAVDEDAFDHHVEITLPVIDLIVADENLRKSWTVDLDARVAPVTIDGRSAAKDQAALTGVEDRGADITKPRVNRNRFARNACAD